jgi:hypothetical protein
VASWNGGGLVTWLGATIFISMPRDTAINVPGLTRARTCSAFLAVIRSPGFIWAWAGVKGNVSAKKPAMTDSGTRRPLGFFIFKVSL